MGFEIAIPLLLVVAGVSAWLGHSLAKRAAPSQTEMDDLKAELEAARETAESVQANVSDHFEQSAVLFGKLASDYREFLEHFSSSAQALGLSEARARELIERGSQPLLSHDETADQGDALEGTAVAADATSLSTPTSDGRDDGEKLTVPPGSPTELPEATAPSDAKSNEAEAEAETETKTTPTPSEAAAAPDREETRQPEAEAPAEQNPDSAATEPRVVVEMPEVSGEDERKRANP